jgi:glycosyltransferase involved in cell wall biosynthesis
MSSMPKVSVIIPVYNGSRYLEETVRSILEQSFSDFEILIVDDGSTDNSKQIALDLQKEDDRILVFEKENTGVSDTRNYGMERAKGECLVFMDADDVAGLDFLKSRVEAMEQNVNDAVCGSQVDYIDDEGKAIPGSMKLQAPGADMLEEILFYKAGVTTIPSNLMFRKAVLSANNIRFDRRLSSTADRMLLCRVALVSSCICLPVVNLFYRVHSGSMYHNSDNGKRVFRDNELFVKLLIEEATVPKPLKAKFLIRNYYMLCGTAAKAGNYFSAFLYGLRYGWARIKYLK